MTGEEARRRRRRRPSTIAVGSPRCHSDLAGADGDRRSVPVSTAGRAAVPSAGADGPADADGAEAHQLDRRAEHDRALAVALGVLVHEDVQQRVRATRREAVPGVMEICSSYTCLLKRRSASNSTAGRWRPPRRRSGRRRPRRSSSAISVASSARDRRASARAPARCARAARRWSPRRRQRAPRPAPGSSTPRRADGPCDLGREQRAAAAVAEDGVRREGRDRARPAAPARLDHPGERHLADAPRRLLGVQVRVGPRDGRRLARAASGSSAKSPPRNRVGSM